MILAGNGELLWVCVYLHRASSLDYKVLNLFNFNKTQIDHAIGIQKKAYQFLLWISNEIDKGRISFSRVNKKE